MSEQAEQIEELTIDNLQNDELQREHEAFCRWMDDPYTRAVMSRADWLAEQNRQKICHPATHAEERSRLVTEIALLQDISGGELFYAGYLERVAEIRRKYRIGANAQSTKSAPATRAGVDGGVSRKPGLLSILGFTRARNE